MTQSKKNILHDKLFLQVFLQIFCNIVLNVFRNKRKKEVETKAK